jgi:hypothetical protein
MARETPLLADESRTSGLLRVIEEVSFRKGRGNSVAEEEDFLDMFEPGTLYISTTSFPSALRREGTNFSTK